MKPLFEKRHYEVLARVFAGPSEKEDILSRLTCVLKIDNPKFNIEKFVNACYDEDSE